MRTWWRGGLAREVDRLRREGRPTILWSLRVTAAAVASYVAATVLFPGAEPLLAPLTAMLVVQVTPVSLLASGLDRVVSVVAGVALAVGFAVVVPLEWWSLGLLILASMMIGQALRLRANLVEVAISGMLVLGVGSLSAGSAAWQRIAETLVGAAVGIAANLLFPPKVATADAGLAIDGLADSLSDLLTRAADELGELAAEGRDPAPAAWDWLDEARRITHDIPRVGAALLHAEQGRRLNVRAVGTADVGPGLRQGLEALEHSAVAVRSMFRAVADATADAGLEGPDAAAWVLPGLAETFREMAVGINAFGQLVRDEAGPASQQAATDVRALQEALDGLHEARARLDELVLAGPPPELLELHAVVLSTVKRLLRELDLGERTRRQVRLLGERRARVRDQASRGARSRPAVEERPPTEVETEELPAVPGERPEGRPDGR